MIKFEKLGLKKCAIWVDLDGTRTWMTIVGDKKLPKADVKKYIKENYKKGDEMDLDYGQDQDGEYQIRSVATMNTAVVKTEEPKEQTVAPAGSLAAARAKAGSTVNNSTEQKTEVTNVTNNFNKSADEKKTTGKVTQPKPVGLSIALQNCGRNTAEVIKGMDGINGGNVLGLIDIIFDKFKEKIVD